MNIGLIFTALLVIFFFATTFSWFLFFDYETLVNNVCDPELDYLAYNKELTKLIEDNNKSETNG